MPKPDGITLVARFSGGLGRISIKVPQGWRDDGTYANTQATATTKSGDESVDLILTPGSPGFSVAEQSRATARSYRAASGKLAVIHPPLQANGLAFSYVTGTSSDGYDSVSFDRNVPLQSGGTGGVSIVFEFAPSVSPAERESLYLPIVSSLTYR